ncbi:MAG: hypothetical protein LIP08_04495 [Bacteroides sp.]|nr:hypothetical protein [Bacteroides sp.]
MNKKIWIRSASFRRGGNPDILCDPFLPGAQEARLIPGHGVHQYGEIKENPALQQAYEAGKTI